MKKAFEILAYTMLELVITILLLSGFYYMFSSLILSSLGDTVKFELSYIWQIILRFTPSCAILSIMLMIFSFIKRNCTFGEMILPYAIVSALVWVVLVPLTLIYDNGTIGGIASMAARVTSDMDSTGLFSLPDWTAYLVGRFELLHVQLAGFFHGGSGGFGLMQYASFFLSLAAIGCFARFSSWRLWNAFFVIFAFAASLVLNSYMFDAAFMDSLNLGLFWAKWLPLFVNAFIFVFNTIIGIILLIIKKRREWR